jgi:hypothetical protein
MAVVAKLFPLRGVLTLLVIPPSRLPCALESLLWVTRPSMGLLASTLGLVILPACTLELVTVAALDRVLIKLGKKEDRGEVGLAGVSRGDPLGDLPVNPPEGRGM